MNDYQQSRDLAVGLLKQGKSPSETWEALVSGGMDERSAETLVKDLLELRRRAQASMAQPPSAPTLPVAQTLGWNEADKGSVWTGLCAGTFCGCWAIIAVLLSSRTMGSETKRGIYIGFFINLIFSFIYAIAHKR
jgi:hypothetical protein